MSRRSILFVEDNNDDAERLVAAFASVRDSVPLIRVHDGADALDYLFCRGRHAARSPDLPVFVLLPWHSSPVTGAQVLREIRASAITSLLPVVVVTSANPPSDVAAAYAHRANSCVHKPASCDDWARTCSQLALYWTSLNRAPST